MERIDMNRFDGLIKTKILARTTPTTYNALRCTSKEFELLAKHPYTKDLHNKRNPMVSGFLMERLSNDFKKVHHYAPSRSSPPIDLAFMPDNSHILASSEHGLMVFKSPHANVPNLMIYHVSKPATRQYLRIPNPNTKNHTYSVSIVTMSSHPLRYKITKLSMSKVKVKRCAIYWPVRIEVFDSKKWAWKTVEVLDLPSCVYPVGSQNTVVTGCVYTMLSTIEILKFDVYSERLTILPPPFDFTARRRPDHHSFQLLKIDNKLAVACRAYYENIWSISIRSNDGIWTLQYQVQEQPWVIKPYLSFDDPSSMISTAENIYLFFKGNDVDNTGSTPFNLYVYKSDFEDVDLRGRK